MRAFSKGSALPRVDRAQAQDTSHSNELMFCRYLRLKSLLVVQLVVLPCVLAGVAAVAEGQTPQNPPPQPPPVTSQSSVSSTIDKATALQKSLGADFKQCPFCDLRGADLSGRDLTNANLAGANLTGAKLQNAKLNGAVLVRANLTNANLSGAILNDSEKGHTNLTGANLTGAVLVGAKLEGAIFEFADLTCADFSNTDTTKAHFGPGLNIDPRSQCRTKFRNAILGCEFRRDWQRLETAGGTLPQCEEVTSNYYCGAVDVSKLPNVIFVSNTSGTDSDTCGASIVTSCKTIQKGIARCNGPNCNVLVAYDRYSPAATIELRDGVNVYGGCATMPKPDPEYISLVYAPAGGVAGVKAVDTKAPTLFQGFTIFASNAVQGGPNLASVGFSAQNNAALSLTYVSISAAMGANGAPGNPGSPGSQGGNANGQNGGTNNCSSNANGGAGGAQSSVQVTDGPRCCAFLCFKCCLAVSFTTNVGSYGNPGNTGNWAAGGGPGSNVLYACPDSQRPGPAGNGIGGNPGGCDAGGTPSPNTIGGIQNGAWVPSVSGGGQNGGAGGGGGGGGSGGNCAFGTCFCGVETYPGVAGGGGGAGGCGGTGGGGGQQGGASIALMINGGKVAMTNGSILGGTGGNGGQGGNGREGGGGGAGAGAPSSNPCNDQGGAGGTGGPGGAGGAGAGGAGGNGGPAFGVITFGGGTFTQTTTIFYLGSSGGVGGFGAGGSKGGGSCAGNNGSPGTAGTVANQQSF